MAAEDAERHLIDLVGAVAELDDNAAQRVIEGGGVWLDRFRILNPTHVPDAAQVLTVHFPPTEVRTAHVTSADIIYEDDVLLVLNKAPGVYVTMTPWAATGDVRWAMQEFLRAREQEPPPLHMAHQLDRDTSGVLVFSKHPRANALLQNAFLDGSVEKRYLALVAGSPDWDKLELRTGHGRGPYGLFQIYPLEDVGMHPEGRPHRVKDMETHFAVVERFEGVTLVEARPITGRTHQIRLHLKHAGYPVLGDLRYGGPSEIAGLTLSHHLLHAATLHMPHPFTRTPLQFNAPFPPLFADVIRTLQTH